MKKIFSVLIILFVSLSFVSCGGNNNQSVSDFVKSNFQLINESSGYREVNLKLKNISGKKFDGRAEIKVHFSDGTSEIVSGNMYDFDAGDIRNVSFTFSTQNVATSWEWVNFKWF